MYYDGKFGITFVLGDIKCSANNGVIIYGSNTRHTWNDWKLIPKTRPIISPPEIKVDKVDVNSINGDGIDVSEALTGYPLYKNRKLEVEFYRQNDSNWTGSSDISKIVNWGHGKNVKLILDDDPMWYYEGRMSITELKSDKYWSIVRITCDLSPFASYVYSSDEMASGDLLWDMIDFSKDVYPNLVTQIYDLTNDPQEDRSKWYVLASASLTNTVIPYQLSVRIDQVVWTPERWADGKADEFPETFTIYEPDEQQWNVSYSAGDATEHRTRVSANIGDRSGAFESQTLTGPQFQTDPGDPSRVWLRLTFDNFVISDTRYAYYSTGSCRCTVIYRERKL